MATKTFNYNCVTCGKTHSLSYNTKHLTKNQLKGIDPIETNFVCNHVARMYRALSFVIDSRVNFLREDMPAEAKSNLADELKAQWGTNDFDKKLERFIDLDLVLLGVPEEYYELLTPIIYSYCCGYYYPAMTGAGSLGERILNRLILKTRDHFKSTDEYKKIYRKNSFDQWDQPVNILEGWGVISNVVADAFLNLKQYRNESIHYNDGYNFQSNARAAVKLLAKIIDLQFNYMKRNDLFWVFTVPGEIWVRSEATDQPFVKEFILPHCLHLTAYCEPTATPPKKGANAPLKPIKDEDFLEARKNRAG